MEQSRSDLIPNPAVRRLSLYLRQLEAFRRKDYAALHSALNLKPWQASPLEVDDGPPGWGPGSAGNASWPTGRVYGRS